MVHPEGEEIENEVLETLEIVVGENTLETSGKDVKIHSKRVEKIGSNSSVIIEMQDVWRLHLKCLGHVIYQGNLLHSFRVYFHLFSTRFECIFTSSPLVSSVFLRHCLLVRRVTFKHGSFVRFEEF